MLLAFLRDHGPAAGMGFALSNLRILYEAPDVPCFTAAAAASTDLWLDDNQQVNRPGFVDIFEHRFLADCSLSAVLDCPSLGLPGTILKSSLEADA